MRKSAYGKYVALTITLLIVALAIISSLFYFNVFGASRSTTYVDKSTAVVTNTIDTDEGDNRQGRQGSEAPVSIESLIPTVVGKKGTEDNPFVLLEIVPEYSFQQMAYLNMDNQKISEYQKTLSEKYKEYLQEGKVKTPSDDEVSITERMGIDFCKRNNKYLDKEGGQFNEGNLRSMLNNTYGYWAGSNEYDVFKIGTDSEKQEKETSKCFDITSLYTVELTAKDVSAEGYDSTEFINAFNKAKSASNDQNKTPTDSALSNVSDFIKTYSIFFAKDDNDKTIPTEIKEDPVNWHVSENNSSGYTVTVHGYESRQDGTASSTFTEDYNKSNLVSKLSTLYPSLFKEDDGGQKIPSKMLTKDSSWSSKVVESVRKVIITDDIYNKLKDGSLTMDKLFSDDTYNSIVSKDSAGKTIDATTKADTAGWSLSEETENITKEIKDSKNTISAEDYAAFQNGTLTIKELAEKYSDLFSEVSDILLEDKYWTAKKEDKTAGYENLGNKGFLYVNTAGKGKYSGWNSYWSGTYNANINEFTVSSNASENVFDYYPTEAELLAAHPDATKTDNWHFWDGNFKTMTNNYISYGELNANDFYEYNSETISTYIFICNANLHTISYKTSDYIFYTGNLSTYKFVYYGLKSNNVLKRSLFIFKTQEECDNFYLNAVTATPAELNALMVEDSDDTLDFVERADMFFFGQYEGNGSNDLALYNTYNHTILGNSVVNSIPSNQLTFKDNDLEWELCKKIIQRQSEVQSLPLITNQNIGKLFDADATDDNVHMYVTSSIQDEVYKGTINNIGKLYLISVQFDLLLRKEKKNTYYANLETDYGFDFESADGDKFERSFMEDIYPNIKTVDILSALVNTDRDETIEIDGKKFYLKKAPRQTGYYERKLPIPANANSLTDEEKEKCYYLWNAVTFYPEDVPLDGSNVSDENVKKYILRGYLPTFFNTLTNPFNHTDMLQKGQFGSDGTDDKNTGIVNDGSMANVNRATIIGLTEGVNIANKMLDVIYKIMNNVNDDSTPDDMIVYAEKFKKYYTKLSDTEVCIDYSSSSEAHYSNDKTIYLKVTVKNPNNQPGVLKKIELVDLNGNAASSTSLLPKDTMDGEELTPVDCYDEFNKNKDKGYNIQADSTRTFFVGFSRADWKNGFEYMEFTTRARIKDKTGLASVFGTAKKSRISITDRSLFQLQ